MRVSAPNAHSRDRILSRYLPLVRDALEEIGAGGMGRVYRARHKLWDRPVAIKRMRPEVGMSGRDKSQFLREAILASRQERLDNWRVLQELAGII